MGKALTPVGEDPRCRPETRCQQLVDTSLRGRSVIRLRAAPAGNWRYLVTGQEMFHVKQSLTFSQTLIPAWQRNP